MTEFTEKVVEIIKNIPEGHVMSYGEIAEKAGSKRAARQVARSLHTMTKKHDLPWHRVVNKNHEISIQDTYWANIQMKLLEEEGHVFQGKKIID